MNELKVPQPITIRRFKQWLIQSISHPANFPHYLTAVFTLLLAIFAIFAWIESRKGTAALQAQSNAQQEQLSIMRAEQRPWLYATTIAIASPLTYTANGATIHLDFVITNVGHSPATHMTIFIASVTRIVGQFDVSGEQDKVCSGHSGMPFGQTLFPGQTVTQRIGTGLSENELETARKTEPKLLPIFVLGCISYELIGAGDQLRTDFALQILQSDLRVIDPTKGDIPVTGLAARYFVVGNSYAH